MRLQAEAAAEEYLRYNETNSCSRLLHTGNLINYIVYNGGYFLYDIVCNGVIYHTFGKPLHGQILAISKMNASGKGFTELKYVSVVCVTTTNKVLTF